ncbi:MAG: SGNH/GDSL hydrolase family protein [Planctomycetaceae bacterium]
MRIIVFTWILLAVPVGDGADNVPFTFRDGDRIVFLGDSITQSGQYPLYLECALLEQFSEWKLTFRNAGWGSDRAWLHQRIADTDMNGDAMLKLQGREQEELLLRMVTHGLTRDVLPLQPSVVIIMYGANEVRDGDHALKLHIRALREIMTQLRKADIRVVLLSPSPEEPGTEWNARHEKFISAVRDLATAEKIHYIDQFHPVLEAVIDARKADSSFAYTRDGVHPHPAGHRMMAKAILEGLGMDGSMLAAENSPLLAKVTEKSREYFHRWREIQIPALLVGTLNSSETRDRLKKADQRISELEIEIDRLRK